MLKRIFLLMVLTFCFSNASRAGLTIEISEGLQDALPIAIVPFKWEGQGEPPQNIAEIISADLQRSGQFRPLAEKDMLAKPYNPTQVQYKNWRILDVPNLVIGQVRSTGADVYAIDFYLLDVFRQKQITAFRYNAKGGQLRKIAHKISDIIYEELTGVKGAFDTRIVYIKKFPNSDPKPYRLYLSDADTFGEQEVMRHHMPLFSPTWSRDGSQLAFAMAGSVGQGIFLFDVATGKPPVRITDRSIKASAPSWSPDGKKMAMQVLEGGSADIFVMDLATRKMERITNHWSIDAEPAWSPDGKSLVFTSERGGSPQIYQYVFSTKETRRLTFAGRQNLRAAFSPNGKLITFVHLSSNNGYNIAIMDMESLAMRIVADASKSESEHESPSFAPNGSMIIYAANYLQKGKQGRKTGLVAVAVEGNVRQHFIDTGIGEVREPAWSSYLN